MVVRSAFSTCGFPSYCFSLLLLFIVFVHDVQFSVATLFPRFVLSLLRFYLPRGFQMPFPSTVINKKMQKVLESCQKGEKEEGHASVTVDPQ